MLPYYFQTWTISDSKGYTAMAGCNIFRFLGNFRDDEEIDYLVYANIYAHFEWGRESWLNKAVDIVFNILGFRFGRTVIANRLNENDIIF